jgi:uncharacterized protein
MPGHAAEPLPVHMAEQRDRCEPVEVAVVHIREYHAMQPRRPGGAYRVVMFVLELSFDGDPQRLAARAAHRQRLADLHAKGVLVLAGPWHDDSGAMLVFQTDRDGLRAIMDADPYYTTPGVTVAAVRQWQPIAGSLDPNWPG